MTNKMVGTMERSEPQPELVDLFDRLAKMGVRVAELEAYRSDKENADKRLAAGLKAMLKEKA